MSSLQTPQRDVVLVGAESAGKSTLAGALSGSRPRDVNLAGATVSIERYPAGGHALVDTPGIVHGLDTEAARLALDALAEGQADVLLVLRATHLDDELERLLPLVAGRRGAVAVTHADRVGDLASARRAIDAVAAATGVPFALVDARQPEATRQALAGGLARPGRFTTGPVLARAGWRIEPSPTVLEHRWLGPPLGLGLLLALPVGAVWGTVVAADAVGPLIEALLAPTSAWAATRTKWPLTDVLAGEYGLLTMGPLLLVWALPVVLALALLLGVGKASGLLDRLTTAVHPLVRPFGLTGRDLVRVVAGYGCNVPAVVATRSCSSCSRDATVGAIAFGSACSYQLAATLGVLAAARRPALVVPYLAVLTAGALLHARLLAFRRGAAPAALDLALLRGRAFVTRPRWRDVRREAGVTLGHLTMRAVPVFGLVVVVASLLAATGALEALARPLQPVMGLLRLPEAVALPVIVASVRKDGLLLLAEPSVVAGLDDAQLLGALVLAGALLPCLVTAMTIARERSRRMALRLIARQAIAIVLLTAAITWAGALVVGR